ncbi:hypothetical protein CHS0354_042584 [Potamilus streckersoni]|uniref:Transposase n=1 Tax=Potamilus streckersoni TaxID=2493646 RepID=A0AAE0WAY0_9BIVA|nr:hypothetical protein CHS0354_042584 [Potamilus streckersoni]
MPFTQLLPEVCRMGKYQLDGKKENVPFCSKKHGRHPTLLPGIFTVFCQHGVCYEYQIMKSMESPNIPFTFLRTKFKVAPEAVIYDNACNLHAYCLNIDPAFFARTQFALDALHWFNHIDCSMGYESKLYPKFKSVNTQSVEQNNSKLKSLLSNMTPQNFHACLRFFQLNCNREITVHN